MLAGAGYCLCSTSCVLAQGAGLLFTTSCFPGPGCWHQCLLNSRKPLVPSITGEAQVLCQCEPHTAQPSVPAQWQEAFGALNHLGSSSALPVRATYSTVMAICCRSEPPETLPALDPHTPLSSELAELSRLELHCVPTNCLVLMLI